MVRLVFIIWLLRCGLAPALAGSASPRFVASEQGYVGSGSCRSCHQAQYDLWDQSGHGLAERAVGAEKDRAAFRPSREFHHGSTTTVTGFQSNECQIVTPGFHTNVEPYRVERVIGYEPLRQFLTAAPGGRWQVHEAAYDPKTNAWFNVYGDEDRRPGEWGHWTGRGMNWNSRCADCHNTRLRKNYDETTDSYRTTMAEMAVGCEACHGPLKGHLEWRKQNPRATEREPAPPLVKRSQTLDVCAACHSRRDDLTGEFKPGDSFFDHYSLEILDESDRWYADGQVKDEDYEFASFLGSAMFQSGVHCRDCHRSDSGTGNALCLGCHLGARAGFTNAPVINAAEHGHHKVSGKGGECIGCHMPVTVYMQRHPRHDHGFTIPDPLLTRQLGIPNACTRCHANQGVDWAVEWTGKWYGAKMNRHTRERAQWVGAGLRGEESAKARLVGMLNGGAEPPYWRAVAASLLYRWVGDPEVQAGLLAGLKDGHPLVREKAVRALEPAVGEAGSAQIAARLKGMLEDPVRCVRVAAAWALQAAVDTQSHAGKELQQALSMEADQPRGQFRQAAFLLSRHQPDEALAHLQKAVAWDPFSPPLRYQTAMVLTQTGRTAEALELLAQAEKLFPDNPQMPYGRAAILARAGRMDEARTAAAHALEIRPDFEPAKELLRHLPPRSQ